MVGPSVNGHHSHSVSLALGPGDAPRGVVRVAAATDDLDGAEWFELLPESKLEGDARNAFDVPSPLRVTHLRLHIDPDGGVARLRVHGEPLPDLRELVDVGGRADLAASLTGYAAARRLYGVAFPWAFTLRVAGAASELDVEGVRLGITPDVGQWHCHVEGEDEPRYAIEIFAPRREWEAALSREEGRLPGWDEESTVERHLERDRKEHRRRGLVRHEDRPDRRGEQ